MPKVLIVDDERGTVEMLTIYLKLKNFEVVSALLGQDGLLLAQIEAPDLILLDLMLPDITGDLVCKELRKNPATAGTPIIMISAHGASWVPDQALASGANLFVPKPFNHRELLDQINTLLGQPK